MTATRRTEMKTTVSSDRGIAMAEAASSSYQFRPTPPKGNPLRIHATSRRILALATKISPKLRFVSVFFCFFPLTEFIRAVISSHATTLLLNIVLIAIESRRTQGRVCLRKCLADEDCRSPRKKCLCDGICGMSCIKPGEFMTHDFQS